MAYPYEGDSTAGIDPGRPTRVLMGDEKRLARHPTPPPVVPQDPRLHAIDSAIRTTTERLRAHVQGLDMKADAIVGTVPQDDAKGAEAAPVNGALDQIEMSLRALKDAVTELGYVERRFDGLA